MAGCFYELIVSSYDVAAAVKVIWWRSRDYDGDGVDGGGNYGLDGDYDNGYYSDRLWCVLEVTVLSLWWWLVMVILVVVIVMVIGEGYSSGGDCDGENSLSIKSSTSVICFLLSFPIKRILSLCLQSPYAKRKKISHLTISQYPLCNYSTTTVYIYTNVVKNMQAASTHDGWDSLFVRICLSWI